MREFYFVFKNNILATICRITINNNIFKVTKYLIYNTLFVAAFEDQVDKPSSGDLRFVQQWRRRQIRQQLLCNITRLRTQRLRQLHRHIARKIAVLRLLGALKRNRCAGSVRHGSFECGGQQIRDRCFCVGGHAVRLRPRFKRGRKVL